MRAIQEAIRLCLVDIAWESERIVADTLIDTMSSERLSAWEKCLEITPEGTIEQRRLYLKSVIRGFGKLNEAKIKAIVNTLTGSNAAVRLERGVIMLDIERPINMAAVVLNNIESALNPRIPVHLGLAYELGYLQELKRLYTGAAYQLAKTVYYETKAVSTDFAGLTDEDGIQFTDNEYGFLEEG